MSFVLRRLSLVEKITLPAYINHATPKDAVRFIGYYRIKQHAPLLLSETVKSIPFLRCRSTEEAECFCLLNYTHNSGCGLQRVSNPI